MTMKKLHPGAKWLFRASTLILAFFASIFIFVFLGQLVFGVMALAGVSAGTMIGAAVFFLLFFVIFVITITEVYAQMSYNRWFYEFGPNGLRLERGIIWKRYSNVPYDRVQNVDIHRGIIARLCGFSSVMIQTAGFSVGPRGRGAGAEGYIPAVTMKEAEEIREFIMKKISKNSGSGQGM